MPPRRPDTQRSPRGTLLVALGASLWGFDSPLRWPLTETLDSTAIVLGEHVILSCVLVAVVVRRSSEWSRLGVKQWLAALWISWGGSALGTVCFTQAIKLGSPTSAVFLQKLQPLFAVLLARLVLGEIEPSRIRYWIRLAVAMGAAYLISFGDGAVWSEVWSVRGAAAGLAVTAAGIWGSCTVMGRYVLPNVSVTTLTGLRIVLAVPLLIALAAARDSFGGFAQLGWRGGGALVALALVPGLAALLLYYRGLRATPASFAALGELCFPAAAALLNWLVLGVAVSAVQLTGVALLWFAVLWPFRLGPPSGPSPVPRF